MHEDIFHTKYGIAKIVTSGWQLFTHHFKTILILCLILYLPVNTALSFFPVQAVAEKQATEPSVYLPVLFLQLLHLFFGIIATIAFAKLIEDSLQGTTLSWQASIKHGVSRLPAAIGTGLLSFLILFGLFLLLIVPGVIWSIYYAFSFLVVAVRHLSGKKALDYSKSLVKGQWWRVAWFLFLIVVTGILCALPLAVLFEFTLAGQLHELAFSVLTDITTTLCTVITIVFFLNSDYLKNPVVKESLIN